MSRKARLTVPAASMEQGCSITEETEHWWSARTAVHPRAVRSRQTCAVIGNSNRRIEQPCKRGAVPWMKGNSRIAEMSHLL